MQIEIRNLGKKFYREWIFRGVNLTLNKSEAYAFTGHNGSGKSTLMLTLAGILPPTQGEVFYSNAQQSIAHDDFYQYQSVVAPYMELIEEYTLAELLDFHLSFKPPLPAYSSKDMLRSMYLENAKHKYIKQFSSGMKQRLKLGLAFYVQSPVLFLDEPCSNLDHQGIQWYKSEIQQALKEKLIIICSNQPYEYDFSKNIISIEQYK